MEQEQTSILSENIDKKEENSYGKFKSAEDLLKAYTALESEFTKRSQKLKEYERSVPTARSVEEQAEELVKKYPIASDYAEELAQEVAVSKVNDNNKLKEALLEVLVKKVKSPAEMARDSEVIDRVLQEESNRDKVINGYLARIHAQQVPTHLRGGAIPTLPTYQPDSVREAGEIAKQILQKL